jgi:hypothetical protein
MVKAYQLAAVHAHRLALSMGDGRQRAAFQLCDFGMDADHIVEWLQALLDGDGMTDPKVQAWEARLHNTMLHYKPYLSNEVKMLNLYSNLAFEKVSDARRYGTAGRGDGTTFLVHDNWGAVMGTHERVSSLTVTASTSVQEITDWIIGEIDRLAREHG